MRLTAALALIAALTAAPLLAKVPLSDVPEIDDGLFAIALADELRKTCDTLDARMLRAYSTINALKSRARELGYSDAEIEEHVTSRSEKARMRARGETYLKANGVAVGDAAGYCALGRAEIARKSAIGRLLRAR